MPLSTKIEKLTACVRNVLRSPGESTRKLATVREEVRGAEFARRWPAPTRNGVADLPDNPLLSYFNGIKEGPGIWKWRHYFEAYHRHLHRFVGSDLTVVEIGVFSGGSMPMWRSYFGDRCVVHGIDIEEACRSYAGPNITIHIGDQADRSFWKTFRQRVPLVDVVIDDGGHEPEQQMVTLEEMLPHVRPGGVYVCEDIHGTGNRFAAFTHALLNELNRFPRAVQKGQTGGEPSPFQAMIQSIHMYPFMVVIEKRHAALGSLVAPRHGTQWQPFL